MYDNITFLRLGGVRNPNTKQCVWLVIFIISTFFLNSCRSLGPKVIVQDRINYTNVLSDSWKEQMLVNIVKLRYGDAPIFLDISSVITSYEISARADIGGNMDISPAFGSGANMSLNGTYANRPTISYTPLSGERFTKSLMTPIPVFPIFSLLQSGYPIDLVFRIMIQSINGLENRHIGEYFTSPEYYKLLSQLKYIQESGYLRLRLTSSEGIDRLILVFEQSQDEEIENKISEVIRTLRLDPKMREFNISYGEVQHGDNEIVILSRSMLKVLNELSMYVEVPSSHISDNKVSPSISEVSVDGEQIPRLINIHYSLQEPEDAFVSIVYGGYWFWIDNKDFMTKKIFSFMMFTFSLVETGGHDSAPFVTVPVR